MDEIYRDLESVEEPVKGHALILLARLVRKRNKAALERIEKDPDIMKKILSKSFQFSSPKRVDLNVL